MRTGKLESAISVDWAHLPSTRKVLPSQCSARLGLQLVLPRTYGLTTPTYTRTKSSILGRELDRISFQPYHWRWYWWWYWYRYWGWYHGQMGFLLLNSESFLFG